MDSLGALVLYVVEKNVIFDYYDLAGGFTSVTLTPEQAVPQFHLHHHQKTLQYWRHIFRCFSEEKSNVDKCPRGDRRQGGQTGCRGGERICLTV